MTETLALFSEEAAREASRPHPDWVVEINEILLFTYGGSRSGAADWWVRESGKPGIVARTHHLLITPAGASLYLACEDQEEAEWLASYLHDQGMHRKVAVARRIGQKVTCARCREKRKFWANATVGRMCRPCFREWADWTRRPQAGGAS